MGASEVQILKFIFLWTIEMTELLKVHISLHRECLFFEKIIVFNSMMIFLQCVVDHVFFF